MFYDPEGIKAFKYSFPVFSAGGIGELLFMQHSANLYPYFIQKEKLIVVRLKKPLRRLAKKVGNPIRKLRLGAKQTFGWLETPKILPFRGFGNQDEICVRGMVLEDRGLAQPEESDKIWQNILAMYKRFKSDVIPGVQVKVTFYGYEEVVETDEQGFFEARFFLNGDISDETAWHPVQIELLDRIMVNQEPVVALGEVMILQRESNFGIISDVDDTILISHATNTWKKFRLLMLKNAHTRLPFEGVAAFYRALQEGKNCLCFNPIFFVSSSEWNLYDLLADFCAVQGIPKGPFLLKTLKDDWYKVWKSGGGNHDHKLVKIRHILTTFHGLDFILIGDSGQHDAELYSQAVEEFPGRIKAIYIRDVSHNKRHREVQEIARTMHTKGVEMLVVENTEAAAAHAIACGYIAHSAMESIKENRERDLEAPRQEGLSIEEEAPGKALSTES
ncbi:MAG: phosphatase domain-containing protein [Bacteroidia bacterium]